MIDSLFMNLPINALFYYIYQHYTQHYVTRLLQGFRFTFSLFLQMSSH